MLFTFIKRKIRSIILEETEKERVKLIRKIETLEKEISELKVKVTTKGVKENRKEIDRPSITIEHITIENIHIDNADLSSNFGQLGIKDLSGQLNIGTTYGATPLKHQLSGKKCIQNEHTPSFHPIINIQEKNKKIEK